MARRQANTAIKRICFIENPPGSKVLDYILLEITGQRKGGSEFLFWLPPSPPWEFAEIITWGCPENPKGLLGIFETGSAQFLCPSAQLDGASRFIHADRGKTG
jgi:hypothetical protein